jgi:hypothetical protein
MAGLNLLAAIIIYWNTKHLGQAVAARQRAGLNCDPVSSRISPRSGALRSCSQAIPVAAATWGKVVK